MSAPLSTYSSFIATTDVNSKLFAFCLMNSALPCWSYLRLADRVAIAVVNLRFLRPLMIGFQVDLSTPGWCVATELNSSPNKSSSTAGVCFTNRLKKPLNVSLVTISVPGNVAGEIGGSIPNARRTTSRFAPGFTTATIFSMIPLLKSSDTVFGDRC
jgi:hypothetical protein